MEVLRAKYPEYEIKRVKKWTIADAVKKELGMTTSALNNIQIKTIFSLIFNKN